MTKSESEIVAYLPPRHRAQIEIADNPARFKVVAAGRRFGKGALSVISLFRRASIGGQCRFIAPTYASDSYQSAWKMSAKLAGQIPGMQTHLQRREFNFAQYRGGGWLQFRTAEEPDSLRGEGIDFVVFDEAAHISNLEEMWEQCVRPSLMDRRGDAWFISTPAGFNFFNTLHQRARTDPDWASFQFPTSANPHIDGTEIAALRASLPALVARQEIDAEFVQLSGSLFKRANIAFLEHEPAGVSWVRSWDLAFTTKTTSDYTAGAKVGMTADGTVVVAHVVCDRLEWPEAVRLIAQTAQMDGRGVRQGIECVAAQVGALQTLLRDPVLLPYSFEPVPVDKDKLTRALPLVARSEQGKFAIVRGPWNQSFLDQLFAFPSAEHDDQVDACSGALHLLSVPTGAIRDPNLIRIGSNRVSPTQRVFRPARLAL